MESNPFSLKENLVLVTGASSGIGRQCALSCGRMGARVIMLGRDQSRLNETMALMKEDGGNHMDFAVDLLDHGRVKSIVEEIVNRAGKIDGLINCAGISTTIPLNAVSAKKLEHFFQTNVAGAVHLTKQVVRPACMSEKGGSIIFISSVMGVAGDKGKVIYSMTKSALLGVARSMSVELASRNIRVNCISPGVVESPMSGKAVYSRNEESFNRIRARHPLGLGKPEDVANACIYLLSAASSWVTGTNMVVDGGFLAR